MTGIVVTSEACYAELDWTGVENTFVPGFRALADSDVHVYSRDADGVVTELTNPTHFTVSRDSNGAVTVTRVSFPTAPKDILIERITPATQTVSFTDLESFPAEIYTRLHTAAAMRAAEARRKLTAMQTTIDGLASLEADLEQAVEDAEAAATTAGNALTALQGLITETTILYFKDGVPNNAFGKNGDVYVQKDSATWLLYGPKAAGAWGASVGELKPVAGNVSQASNAAASNRLVRSAGADKTIKDSAITVADDGTLTGARFNTPTQSYEAATKAFAESLFATNDAMLLKGAIDCSANPNYPAADAGHVYKVSVAGKIGGGSGPNVEVGDTLYCFVDSSAAGNHATVGANWWIQQANVDSPLKVADIGATVQGYDADTLKADVADDLDVGFTSTSKDQGTKSSGTFTPTFAAGNVQHYTNGGAHTLGVPTGHGTMQIDMTNNGSAGAVTTSSYTKVTGDTLTTTNGHKFRLFISTGNGGSHLHIQALQ